MKKGRIRILSVVLIVLIAFSPVNMVYAAEQTAAPDPAKVEVVNNTGSNDTITVTDLVYGDTVNVYESIDSVTALGFDTVAEEEDEAIVSLTQLGAAAGKVYVTVTAADKLESDKVAVNYAAEKPVVSDQVKAEVVNNSDLNDIITVSGLLVGDIVKVYASSTGSTVIGTATAAVGKSEVIISLPQLSVEAGKIYISVTSKDKPESGRIEVSYAAEAKTTAPKAEDIEAVNNYVIADIITVKNLAVADRIKVYTEAEAGLVLGTAVVVTGKNTVSITTTQLGTAGGYVYVSLTSKGKLESARTKVAYEAEKQTGAPSAADIAITNNSGINDTVVVGKLKSGDIVKVYDAANEGTMMKAATAGTGSDQVTISIQQLGLGTGTLYISLTNVGKMESGRTPVTYLAESKTTAPIASEVSVVNNAGVKDTITVNGVSSGDTVRVYSSAVEATPLAFGKVASGKNTITISAQQLGGDAGSIYVSKTAAAKLESDRTKVDFVAEKQSDAPLEQNISITNNAVLKDTVTVRGLQPADIVKVYAAATGGLPMGTATVAAGKNEAVAAVAQLGTDVGEIYVSVTSTTKLESKRQKAGYSAEGNTIINKDTKIEVINNAGMNDTISVNVLKAGDLVKVYESATGDTVLVKATVGSGKTEVSLSVKQLGDQGGKIYVTVTSIGLLESARVSKDFDPEVQTDDGKLTKIVIVNNSGISDTVTVSNLVKGDLIKVYNGESGGSPIGSGAVGTGKTDVAISIVQLGADGGVIYLTVTSAGKLESERVLASFDPEEKSTALSETDIEVINKASVKDTVKVKGRVPGDVIKLYASEKGTTVLGTAVVPAKSSEAVIGVAQLGSTSGSVWVTVTSKNKRESARTEKEYDPEAQSEALSDANIDVYNNFGISDTVKVTQVSPGETIRAYGSASDGTALGFATVAAGKQEAIITIPQLGTEEGKVYVSIARVGELESGRVPKKYDAEGKSDGPDADKVLVINNTGSDLVIVYGLEAGDVIKLYANSSGGSELGKATVQSKQTQVVINVKQLGAEGGMLYISVTKVGKNESNRASVTFEAE